jgi:predicted negative regulator of RcsB-dependent stress response
VTDGLISDDEQWEKLKAWWKANGTFIITGLIVGLAIIGGWRWWQHYQAQRQLSASALYSQFEQALNKPGSDGSGADAIAKNLIKNYDDTPYSDQAALALAGKEASANHLDKATSHLHWVIGNASDKSLVRLARLRLARVEIAQGKPKAALSTLAAVEKPGGFKALYAETRGDAWRARGETAKAHDAYNEALSAHTDKMGDTTLLRMKLRQTASASHAEAEKS